MKRTRSLSWLLLLALLATCLLPVSGLAASPDVSGSNSAAGSYGKFPSNVNMSFDLANADATDALPTVVIRVQDGNGTYQDITSIATTGDGSYSFSISSSTLNKLSVGSATVYASAASAGNNDAIPATSIGSITVQAVAFSIEFEYADGGKGYANKKTAMPGEEVSIDVKTEAGYYFVNWTVVKGDPGLRKVGVASQIFDMPSGNVVLRANFRSNTGESSDSSSSSSSSDSSSTGTSSSNWTSGQSDGIPNYTPVMVNARNLPVTGTVLSDDAPIYAAPLAGTASAGAFKKDDELTMLGYDNGFFAVLVGSRTMGYVAGNDTQFTFDPGLNATLLQATTTGAAPAATEVPLPTVTVDPDATDDPEATSNPSTDLPTAAPVAASPGLPVGSPVLISGRDGENWLISSGGQEYKLPANGSNGLPTLSIAAEDLTAIAGSYTFPTTGTVRDGGVKIRASASTSSSQLGTLAGRATFTSVGYENGFMVIQRTTGETGYVQADYVNVSFSPPLYGTLLLNAAAYTRGVSQSRYFLKTVPVGTLASIHGREGSWWRVSVEGETMWIKEESINVPTIK